MSEEDWEPSLPYPDVQRSEYKQVHVYISTACHHTKHTSCRSFCKWCKEPCVCKCHAVTIPEDKVNLDEIDGGYNW